MITLATRIRRSSEKTLPFFAAILGGRAPGFVYGGRVRVLPVFTYHVPGASFEQDLELLRRGGYRTAGAEELSAYAAGTAEPDGRTVALTFDDGDESLVQVVVPLLQRYGFRGMAFVVAGLVPPRSEGGLAGWAELRAALATGVIEVGSHSLFHHRVPISPDLAGFVAPGSDVGFNANVPIPRLRGDERPAVGTPIYHARPRYTARRAFRPDPDGLERCHNFVREHGDEVFRQPSALRALRRLAPSTGTYETRAEADAAVEADMRAAFELLQAECPNPAARYLCFPWYARTPRADRLAGLAGGAVLLGGFHPSRLGTRGHHPPLVQRLFPVLMGRLPGPDRRGLAAILLGRVRGQVRRRR
jgi:peptidoglycan/xylan/chitin deacetylase (PgdA/CDA1 family)